MYQCAEIATIAVGFGRARPMDWKPRLHWLSSIAFIGDPWPTNATGIRLEDIRRSALAHLLERRFHFLVARGQIESARRNGALLDFGRFEIRVNLLSHRVHRGALREGESVDLGLLLDRVVDVLHHRNRDDRQLEDVR